MNIRFMEDTYHLALAQGAIENGSQVGSDSATALGVDEYDERSIWNRWSCVRFGSFEVRRCYSV